MTDGEVVAIDGKTVRGSYDKSRVRSAIHMVNTFATDNGVCLAQAKVNSKTKEITELPKLLKVLHISGCLVTIDAMGCQRKIAQKIVDKSADYILAVKGNQALLEQAFDAPSMMQSFDGDSYSMQEKSHGRLETRCALVNDDLSVRDGRKLFKSGAWKPCVTGMFMRFPWSSYMSLALPRRVET